MGKTFWLVSISSDNSDKTFSSGFNMQGFDKKSRKKVDVMAPDDRLLYYINDKRVFSATATVTSSMFEDNSIIWTSHDEKETFPYRVHTKKGCNSCFNRSRFDPSDWLWCPDQDKKEEIFECSKLITGKDVIEKINLLI